MAPLSPDERLAVLENEVSGGFDRADRAFTAINLRLDSIDSKLTNSVVSNSARIGILEMEHAKQQATLRALTWFAAIPAALLSIVGTVVGVIIGVKQIT